MNATPTPAPQTPAAAEAEDGLICVATFAGRLVYPPALIADRWCVVWGPDRREAYFRDRALAEAYAAAHRGQLVPLAALTKWPDRVGDIPPNMPHHTPPSP